MKTLLSTLMATAAAASMTQAFTIDFNALVVPTNTTVTVGSSLTIPVSGYGNVRFETVGTDSLVVGNKYSNGSGTFQNSLELDPGETVIVTFLGPDELNVNFDIIGLGFNESANTAITGPSEYQMQAIGGDGIGLAAVSWDAVPEPSSSLLILMGASSLILRRRRQ
ncbi:MAG: PEP-CTERM sorting domain-containing protein [Akkermansiaceae bacterium]